MSQRVLVRVTQQERNPEGIAWSRLVLCAPPRSGSAYKVNHRGDHERRVVVRRHCRLVEQPAGGWVLLPLNEDEGALGASKQACGFFAWQLGVESVLAPVVEIPVGLACGHGEEAVMEFDGSIANVGDPGLGTVELSRMGARS